LNVKTDCNNASGSYTAQDGSITIEMGPMTMAMCGPDSLSEQFVSRLDYAAIYFFQGDDLLIDLFADGGTMGFSENPPPPPPEPTQPPAVDPVLIGKVWKWFEFLSPDGERIFVNNPEQYTVEFLGDGSVRVNADCNSANGSYTASRGSINIEILTMTRAACPPGSYGDQFVNLLNTAAIYFFSGDTLLMDLPMDSGTMQLAVQPPTAQPPVDKALIGKAWTWQEFRAPGGEQVLINDPQQYTVQFAADGTLAVKADCNNGSGTYTASNGNINIDSTMAMTMAFCPPGSYGNQFVNALFAAAVYRFESGDLFLDLQANAGTMRFKPR
jgi:heat shock protein HslJ